MTTKSQNNRKTGTIMKGESKELGLIEFRVKVKAN
jgi:hypothetical protein